MKAKYDAQQLAQAVILSKSIAEVIRKLGLTYHGGRYQTIRNQINKAQLDTSHFTRQGWSKGLTRTTSAAVEQIAQKLEIPEEKLLRKHTKVHGERLRRVLTKHRGYRCHICGNTGEWLQKPLVLQVHHINGIHSDNRIENLCLLCPNCHYQTGTWGKKARE